MNPPNTTIKTTTFVEFTAVTTAQSSNLLFDIIINEIIDLKNYCAALIHKIFELQQAKLKGFINYQLELVNDKFVWINKFERLISKNEALFISKTALSKYNKLFNLLEKKREEIRAARKTEQQKIIPKRLINAESEDRYFSFHEVKEKIEKIDEFKDKLIYLTEEIYEYKQADIISVNHKLQAYDEQCNQLISKLQTIRKMKSDFEQEFKQANESKEVHQHTQLQINGPINILTNAFKQMMFNVKPNGTPYLSYKIKEVAAFICENFTDENGQTLSQATIQTYLSPNRTDKDPNKELKVRF